MTTETTAKAKITNMRRLTHYQKWDLEELAEAFCQAWGYTFDELAKSPSYGAWVQAEGDDDYSWLDFVKCNHCGQLVAMWQDDHATATCECGNHFEGSEVDWT
jgi:hypothetical protein